MAVEDWTTGTPEIAFQSCGKCDNVFYFRRLFCPSCGTRAPETRKATGKGVVFAISVIARAATPAEQAYVPYAVALVDTTEGFRMMGQADLDLKIGDRVQVRFAKFVDRIVPHFSASPASSA